LLATYLIGWFVLLPDGFSLLGHGGCRWLPEVEPAQAHLQDFPSSADAYDLVQHDSIHRRHPDTQICLWPAVDPRQLDIGYQSASGSGCPILDGVSRAALVRREEYRQARDHTPEADPSGRMRRPARTI
jgi:hypothetical protein